jgi:hypothetical protein
MFHNLVRKTQQFKVFSLFLHQHPNVFFTQNLTSQTFVVLSVEIQNGKHEKLVV